MITNQLFDDVSCSWLIFIKRDERSSWWFKDDKECIMIASSDSILQPITLNDLDKHASSRSQKEIIVVNIYDRDVLKEERYKEKAARWLKQWLGKSITTRAWIHFGGVNLTSLTSQSILHQWNCEEWRELTHCVMPYSKTNRANTPGEWSLLFEEEAIPARFRVHKPGSLPEIHRELAQAFASASAYYNGFTLLKDLTSLYMRLSLVQADYGEGKPLSLCSLRRLTKQALQHSPMLASSSDKYRKLSALVPALALAWQRWLLAISPTAEPVDSVKILCAGRDLRIAFDELTKKCKSSE